MLVWEQLGAGYVEALDPFLVTPTLNYTDIARRWTGARRGAYAGNKPLEVYLSRAASDIDAVIASAGRQRP